MLSIRLCVWSDGLSVLSIGSLVCNVRLHVLIILMYMYVASIDSCVCGVLDYVH